jgi:hypothetical protein
MKCTPQTWQGAHASIRRTGSLPLAGRAATMLIMLVVAAASVLALNVATAKPAHADTCPLSGQTAYLNQYIYSFANNQYVSAELPPVFSTGSPRYGMLRATAGQQGPWEMFTICAGPYFYSPITIQSEANHMFVSAELAYGGQLPKGMLRARSPQVGPWEKFAISCNGCLPDWHQYQIWSPAAGDLYVSAELAFPKPDDYGMLRARTGLGDVGPWEQFDIGPDFHS